MSSYLQAARAAAWKAVEYIKQLDEEAYKAALKKYIPLYKQELEDVYVKAAQEWYDAYAPKRYKRNYSIKNMFDVQWNEGKSELGWNFLSERMTKGKNGYSLYEPVFIQGWHGGASVWGKTCVRTTPVIDIFNPKKDELENKYKVMINEYADTELIKAIQSTDWWGWLNV